MERKNTDQLQQELMTGNDLSRVLSDNDASFQQHDLQETLQALFERRSISKTMLWTRPRSCCATPALPHCTPATGGTPS